MTQIILQSFASYRLKLFHGSVNSCINDKKVSSAD